MKSILSFFLCAGFLLSFCHAEPLNPNESLIVTEIDKDIDYSLSLLEKVVNINSGTMNFEGVKKVGQIFDKELQSIGFQTQWIDGAPFNRAGHLYASYGNKGRKLLLIGHLDTVFAKNSQFQSFKNIDKNHSKSIPVKIHSVTVDFITSQQHI